MTGVTKPILVIFAREPRLGRVKTRLAADLGWVAATAIYRRLLARTIRRLGRDRRWRTVIAITPDRARLRVPLPQVGQGAGDLGVRMMAPVRRHAPRPVVVVGSDIPALDRAHVAAAFRALRGHDAVLGPAADGGYWLIGLRGVRPVPRLAPVRWSGPHALADTLRALGDRRVALLQTLRDLDTVADLEGADLEGADLSVP